MASAETHTHTHTHTHSPAEARDQGSPCTGFGGEGGCLGHDTDSRVTDAAARILCFEVPAPLVVLAVIMAANRPYPVAILAGPRHSIPTKTLRR